MGVVLSAGGAFAWYRDQLGARSGDADDEPALNDEAARFRRRRRRDVPSVSPGRAHAASRRAARGAFLGLSLAHSRAHLTRAVLEGVASRFAIPFRFFRSSALAAALLLTAVARRAPFVRQLQADVYGLPVSTVNREEGRLRRGAARRGGRRRIPDVATRARARSSARAPRASTRHQRHTRRLRSLPRLCPAAPPRHDVDARDPATLLASPEIGLIVVVAIVASLTALAGSHVDRRTGEVVNNFLNSNTLIQTLTDASFFASWRSARRW
jgi:sugar (pentulose or hexulose) kinase